MKSSFKIKNGSVWKFNNSKKPVLVKVFEISKVGRNQQVLYGLRGAASSHICTTLAGFIENYEWIKNV